MPCIFFNKFGEGEGDINQQSVEWAAAAKRFNKFNGPSDNNVYKHGGWVERFKITLVRIVWEYIILSSFYFDRWVDGTDLVIFQVKISMLIC